MDRDPLRAGLDREPSRQPRVGHAWSAARPWSGQDHPFLDQVAEDFLERRDHLARGAADGASAWQCQNPIGAEPWHQRGRKGSRFYLMVDAGERQQAIAEAGGRDPLHRCSAVNAQRRGNARKRVAAERQHRGRQCVELLAGELALLQQGIARRSDQEQLLHDERLVVEMIDRLRHGDDGDVELGTEQAVADRFSQSFTQLQSHPRKTFDEYFRERRIENVGEARWRPQPHRA